MERLKDTIEKYKWLLEVPTNLLECIDWDNLKAEEEDYVFVDATYLVDKIIDNLTETTQDFQIGKVTFRKVEENIHIKDTHNNYNCMFPITDKRKMLNELLYYFVRMEDWAEYYEDMNISKKHYNKLKEEFNY